MKNKKRNITLIAVLAFVCAAVALNWSYNKSWGEADAKMVAAEDAAMTEALADTDGTMNSEYFNEARLTRQVSRDEALELLQTAATSDAASQDTIDGAMNAISDMAAYTMQESQIENLLLAKNFSECVVYIGSDKITVAVPSPAEGLSQESVAIITDVVCSETQYAASQLNIIEVKA